MATMGGGLQDFRLVDPDGVAYGIRQVDNKPRVSAMEYLKDIASVVLRGRLETA